MKLTARKSFIAAVTAVTLSTGALQAAPAWAEDSDSSSSSSFGSSDNGEQTCTPVMKEEKDEDGKKVLVASGEQKCVSKKKAMTEEIKEWVTLITTIASLFAAVLSITKTTDNLAKAFAPK